MKRTKIKICGLTTENDIALVNRLKPDYAGFVMYFPKSKRNVSPESAKKLLALLDGGIKSVAVTVSPSAEQAEEISGLGFDFIQAHGELSREFLSACRLPVIRAYNVSDSADERIFGGEHSEKIVGFVFDAAQPGSGKTFDWDCIKDVDTGDRFTMLAGGLTHENVASAIAAVHPDAVDVSSGVELATGGKDPVLAEKFVAAVRSADGF